MNAPLILIHNNDENGSENIFNLKTPQWKWNKKTTKRETTTQFRVCEIMKMLKVIERGVVMGNIIPLGMVNV